MFQKVKQFFSDHQETIITSVISSAATAATVGAVGVFRYKQVKFNRFEIWAPTDIPDEMLVGKTMELALYMANGKVAVLPAPFMSVPPAGSIAPV